MNDAEGFTAEASLFRKGEEFQGHIVERLLGRGGLGTVWLVRHQMLDSYFALKVLDPKVAEEKPEYVKRFFREAKLAVRIRHPNLVAVHNVGYDPKKNIYYLIMDYVDGSTLRSAITIRGSIPEKEAVKIVLQVTDVLAVAQRFGMVHRDLKPENIMLTCEGDVKLLDLGVAKTSSRLDSLKTSSTAVFGTPAYIAPEQAQSAGQVDSRADIYSLGIILFEMLCGERPYDGKTPAQILDRLFDPEPIRDVRDLNGEVSTKLAALIRLMCAKRPEDRLASPQEVQRAFARMGYEVPTASASVLNADDTENVVRRGEDVGAEPDAGVSRRRLLWAVLAVLAGLALLSVWWIGS